MEFIIIFLLLLGAFVQLVVAFGEFIGSLINQKGNSAQGCLGFFKWLFIFVGFFNAEWWLFAFIAFILESIANNFQPSTTTTPSPDPSPPIPDDLDNILMDLSNGEIKDPVTQEIFHPGEKVYLCHVHRLAYHDDSWQEMECKCMVCGNSAHTKLYVLPHPVNINLDIAKRLKIEFRDIE
ncbi:hypothetical protein NG798_23450 [Ancylothrix sp. C2]|uniref:hypothetical protein n=1 Tax=Ancylothrix sp. D3o TaxID=2953691 RepID=UPI0021BAA82D|nr:hypothetical protein [Ancylothrix sp. D3o]MCT7952761.1 hypothetical protein [Ancylothrix sp. D3o]